MKYRPLERATLTFYGDLLEQITDQSERRWGGLDAPRMLKHLNVAVSGSLNPRNPVPDMGNAFSRLGVTKWVVLEVMEWPKGKIKVPDSITPPAEGTVEQERAELTKAMARFVDELESDPEKTNRHPLCGPLHLHEWSRFHGRHLRHHLMQFGVAVPK
jgi:oxepin-CoA hydrolase/3-oxo-5,6-dehydrosuberyl-CoA semialdehyde dehydrogenase